MTPTDAPSPDTILGRVVWPAVPPGPTVTTEYVVESWYEHPAPDVQAGMWHRNPVPSDTAEDAEARISWLQDSDPVPMRRRIVRRTIIETPISVGAAEIKPET